MACPSRISPPTRSKRCSMNYEKAGTSQGSLTLLAAIGSRLLNFSLSTNTASLRQLGELRLPAKVQYGWQHPSGHCWYVVTSDGGGPHAPPGQLHHLSACSIDSVDGSLAHLGEPLLLPSRPIHVTVAPDCRHVLVAFSQPAAVRVYKLHPNGKVGGEVIPELPAAVGNYPHQVLMTPDGRHVLTTALGQNASLLRPEDPGSLRVFRFERGALQLQQIVAPRGGYGFSPRHLDFHPSNCWVYVSVERQNLLQVYALNNGRLSEQALFTQPLLRRTAEPGIHQIGGAVHVHPSGRFVYVVNRSSDSVVRDGTPVYAGGENTIAVFGINEKTGEPHVIQHIDTGGIHCRTFQIDAGGKYLVAGHITGMHVQCGPERKYVPPLLSLFNIGADGRLTPQHTQPLETAGDQLFWMAMPF